MSQVLRKGNITFRWVYFRVLWIALNEYKIHASNFQRIMSLPSKWFSWFEVVKIFISPISSYEWPSSDWIAWTNLCMYLLEIQRDKQLLSCFPKELQKFFFFSLRLLFKWKWTDADIKSLQKVLWTHYNSYITNDSI